MSEFIEVTDSVFIRKECIEAIIGNSDGTTTVSTDGGNSFTVTADVMSIIGVIDEEAFKEKEIEKLTSQYFGG